MAAPKQITVVLPQLGVTLSRDDPNWEDVADDYMGKLQPLQVSIDQFGVEANALAIDVNERALAAEQSAILAGQAAGQAGANLWLSGAGYGIGEAVVDPVDLFVYRKRTNPSQGTQRPGLDPTNWKNVSVVPDVAGNLVDSGSTATPVAWDAGAIQVPTLTLLGNRTIANPTNLAPRNYVMFLKQDATGGRVPTFDTAYVFPDGIQPQIDLRPGYVTMFSFISDGTKLRASYMPGYPQ